MVVDHEDFTKEDAYVVGIHRYCFRAGEPAKIIDTVMLTPNGLPQRVVFHIVFADGVTDYIVLDLTTMRIISQTDVDEGNIPPISW